LQVFENGSAGGKKTADAEFDHRCFAVTFPFPMLRSEIMKMLKKRKQVQNLIWNPQVEGIKCLTYKRNELV
jgi:hypothetical protein